MNILWEIIGVVIMCCSMRWMDKHVLQHIHSQNRKVGVFGADTLDGYEQVQTWQHKLHIVYADHPAMYK